MSILTLVIIVSSVLFILFAIDLFQRKKLTLLHFIVFIGGGALLLIFSFNQELLDRFGKVFGLTRGADAIVYSSIIFLMYLFFSLLNKLTKLEYVLSKQNTNYATEQFGSENNKRNQNKDQYCFLMRAYNEEQTIGNVIEEIIKKGFQNIVIANDGSSDNTKGVVLKKQQEHKKQNIILLNHLINRGPGAANKTLFSRAKTNADSLKLNRFVTYDADGQMDINDIEKFQKEAQSNKYDVILGSRFIEDGNAHNIPRMRKIILLGSKIVTYWFTGLHISDPPSGYKAISKDAIKKIHLESDGMTYSSELLNQIKKNKLTYTEVGVNIHYTEYSLEKGQKNSNAVKILRELIYKKLFYR